LAAQDETGTPLFELGVVRVATTETCYDSDGGEENKMKASATDGSQVWDRNKYLNIWICDISNGASSGTAGYAYRPTPTLLPSPNIDGIVFDYSLGVNNDNVLTHEKTTWTIRTVRLDYMLSLLQGIRSSLLIFLFKI